MKALKFCFDKVLFQHQSLSIVQKAVWRKSKYWNKGQTLKVFMINGTSAEQAEMKQAFSEIASYTGLKFIYTTIRDESHIRVSFNKGWGSYSYLGTDALFIPKNSETMNIGWRGLDVCRHEALHSIGALHEHQNPNEGIEWDEKAVIADLSGAPNYWTLEEIRFNVLDKIDKLSVDSSNYDPSSIMLYYFPASWTKNGISSNPNTKFSATDIEFMKRIYSTTPEDTIAPVITLKGGPNVSMFTGEAYIEEGATAVDNVDGDISDKIVMDGMIDTSKEGLYHVTYRVVDKAGNKSEKIRSIMIQNKFQIRSFLKRLFPSKSRLSRLTEDQLVIVAEDLGMVVSVEDLKKDTVEKIWTEMNL